MKRAPDMLDEVIDVGIGAVIGSALIGLALAVGISGFFLWRSMGGS